MPINHEVSAELRHKVISAPLWDLSWVRTDLRTGDAHILALQHNDPTAGDAACFSLLRACAKRKNLHTGIQVHADLLKAGFLERNSFLVENLVLMYVKCGALDKARDILDGFHVRSTFAWTALIIGYMQQGQGHRALHCFEQMCHEGVSLSAVSFTCALKACGCTHALEKGEDIHIKIATQGLLNDNVVLGTALIDMYAKCGALTKARHVLEELPARDVFAWTTLISGLAQHGQGEDALDCLECMEREGHSPNAVTYASILKACGSLRAVDTGEQIHEIIAKEGLLRDNIVLGSALVNMYVKCGMLAKAQHALENLPARNVCSWNALIAGYAQQGQGEAALDCYDRMQGEGISPSSATFPCILSACGSSRAYDKGEQIHKDVARKGLLKNNVVIGSALVDMYAKCGTLAKAKQVLEELPARNVVAWTALIEGYAHYGQADDALDSFAKMQREGFIPNAVTFSCILKLWGRIGAIDKGEECHNKIARQGLLHNNIVLGTTLVGMYVKCGALAKAHLVLEELATSDAVLYNVLIAGYAQQGQSQNALICFEQMQRKGLSPDACTFCCILNACSHSGLVDEGQMLFTIMITKYGIEPDSEHFTCMVDLLGRAGHLDTAAAVIQSTWPPYSYEVWHALLAACYRLRNVNVGRWAFEHALQADGSDSTTFILMANLCVAAGMQEDVVSAALRAEQKPNKGQCYRCCKFYSTLNLKPLSTCHSCRSAVEWKVEFSSVDYSFISAV